MTLIPLALVPNPDDPELASCFAPLLVDGIEVRALLDSGAARSAVVARPGMTTRTSQSEETPRSTGALGNGGAGQDLRTQVVLAFGGHELGPMTVDVVAPDHPGHGDLIGQDILARWCCRYRLGIGELEIDVPSVTDGTPIRVGRRGHVMVEPGWPDGTSATAIFDTGASITVVNQAFASAHGQLFEQVGSTQGTDADGTTLETPLLTMAGPNLLGTAFPSSAAVSVDLSAAIASADLPFDMILGWPILRQGSFTIDHANQLAHYES